MPFFADRVQVATATTGTGTIALGAAVAGFRTFAAAAVPNGAEVSYLITDGADWEIGSGVYDSGAQTLTRGLSSSSSGALLNLSGSASVSVIVRAADLAALAVAGAVRLADGSAAAPAVGFPTDPGTGFYRGADDRIYLFLQQQFRHHSTSSPLASIRVHSRITLFNPFVHQPARSTRKPPSVSK